MRNIIFAFLFLLLISAVSCKSGKSTTEANKKLHNIWAVEMINNVNLTASEFQKGLPVIELFVDENRVGGHDGCNQIMGKFTASAKTITFGKIASTMMACPGMDNTPAIGALLSDQTYDYSFGKGKLLFRQNGLVILVMKNID